MNHLLKRGIILAQNEPFGVGLLVRSRNLIKEKKLKGLGLRVAMGGPLIKVPL